MKPRMVTRLTSTGARFGPGGISVALYCEMMPHSGMRANGLTFLNTALRTSPPTLSKYTSMPVGQAVGHAGVEAQLLQDVLALVLGARDAGDATAADLRELADDGADGAGGGGHDDGLTGLGLGDVVEAHVRRQAGHAEDAERGGNWRRLRVELDRTEGPDARAGGLRDVVRLPATVGEHEIAGREGGVARFHHLADGAADHRLS